MQDLIRELREFVRERDWSQFHSPKNLTMALGAEVGELLDELRWETVEESDRLAPEKLRAVRAELGDVVIFTTLLADRLGLDPVACAKEKLAEVRRKYPASKVRGKADKYTRYRDTGDPD